MKLYCRYWNKWLLPYSIGELNEQSPSLASRLEEHLAQCDRCQTEVTDLRAAEQILHRHARSARISQRLDTVDRARTMSSLSGRVLQAIQPDEPSTSPMRWSPSTLSFASVAAFAAVMFMIVIPNSAAKTFHEGMFGHPPTKVVQPAPPAVVPSPFPIHDPFGATPAPPTATPSDSSTPSPSDSASPQPVATRFTSQQTSPPALSPPQIVSIKSRTAGFSGGPAPAASSPSLAENNSADVTALNASVTPTAPATNGPAYDTIQRNGIAQYTGQSDAPVAINVARQSVVKNPAYRSVQTAVPPGPPGSLTTQGSVLDQQDVTYGAHVDNTLAKNRSDRQAKPVQQPNAACPPTEPAPQAAH